jgi:sulfatase maturation enzyme AslB (radical SAM superfamily)
VDGDKILHDTCRIFADGTGSYDIASKAANDWKEKTGQDNTKITIAPENIKHISRATINLINMGYDTINMNCVFENVWSPELAKQFYYELKNLADYLIDNNLPEK